MKDNNLDYLAQEDRSYQDMIAEVYRDIVINENKRVKTITFQVTEDCCMACTYCYQNHKTKNKLNFETAKKFIDVLLNDGYECINTSNSLGIIIDFIGGEPLMEIDLIEQICNYMLNTMIEKKHPWLYFCQFSMGSNGILYDTPKVQQFFKKYGRMFSFSISIDGNKQLHDACRVDLNGNGTYDRAIAAAHKHKNTFGKIPPTKMTIAPENVKYLYDAILNLIKEGYTCIFLNCVYENVWNNDLATILYCQLKKVADYLIENNLYNKIFIRMFNENNFKPMDESDNENWCGGVGDMNLSINHTGNLFPCLRYMESSLNHRQEPIIVGDVNTGYLATEKHEKNYQKISNITRRSQSTDECFYCPIAKGCSWCSAYNYEEFGDVNKRATYICCMHQATALANVYYWNKLYNYLDINKIFEMNVTKEWALKIIPEDEYNYLIQLSERGE